MSAANMMRKELDTKKYYCTVYSVGEDVVKRGDYFFIWCIMVARTR